MKSRVLNNNNNNNASQNIWDQMALMTDEQRDDALLFLECNTEELAGLSDGQCIQAVANGHNLLDYLFTIKLNIVVIQ